MRYEIIKVPYRKHIKTNCYGIAFYTDEIYCKYKIYYKKTERYLEQEIREVDKKWKK